MPPHRSLTSIVRIPTYTTITFILTTRNLDERNVSRSLKKGIR